MKRQQKLLIALGAAVAVYLLARSNVGSTFVTDVLTSGSRGIRNNNPGNIRLSSTTWAGQVPPDQQTDPDFVQFVSPEYGIRAMAKIFKSYMARGLVTVEQIVSTWAPPTENNTQAYVASVSGVTGFDPRAMLSTSAIPALIAAFINQENGSQPYSPAIINQGVSLS